MYNLSISNVFEKKMGRGNLTFFWKQSWAGDLILKERFPDLYTIESVKNAAVEDRFVYNRGAVFNWMWRKSRLNQRESQQLHLLENFLMSVHKSTDPDKWQLKGFTSMNYSVAAFRERLHQTRYSQVPVFAMQWVNWNPKKINCFIWKVAWNAFPSKVNLLRRGVSFGDDNCAFSCGTSEDQIHLFFNCSVAVEMWNRLEWWTGFPFSQIKDMDQLLKLPFTITNSSTRRKMARFLVYIAVWKIWMARNDVVFRHLRLNLDRLFEEIKYTSFLWFTSRQKKFITVWDAWAINPLTNIPM